MSKAARVRALTEAGLVHPSPEAVTSALFTASSDFFLPLDKVQVKYEMLRAHSVDGLSATAAAAAHGYSRAAFYLVAGGPARLEIYEPEADVVRRIFHDTVTGGCSTREISRRLAADQVSTPSGRRAIWGTSTISRLLRNEAYLGRLYFNRTETVPAPAAKKGHRQVVRPAKEWVAIPVPAIIDDQTFTAASKAMMDNTKWSPRRAEPGQWLLKGLVKCGVCGVGTNAHRMRGRNGSWHRYYYCRNHDPIRAGGADRRCPERNIRAESLDTYVFDRIRRALLRPGTLLAGEQAVAARTPTPDDEPSPRNWHASTGR